jgi:CubicO group peptidase (beta-lactamase class C family)
MRTRTLLLSALAGAALFCQSPELPRTPAGTVLAAWLEAINSPDPAAIGRYVARHEPEGGEEHVKMLSGVRAKFGGFDLVRFTARSSTEGTATLRAKKEPREFEFNFEVQDANPPVIAGAQLRPVEAKGPPVARLDWPGAIKALDREATERTSADRFSGVVLVAREGRLLFEKSYGLADREKKIVNSTATRFRLGSMNKMFTAVAALQLVEKGKLDLDAPIGKYLEAYPNQELASKVTLRHLLTHTGGTGDIFGPDFERQRLDLKTLDDYLKLYGNRSLQFAPGARASYSNYGFILAGALIEKASGMSYYDYVKRHIFEPAGMASTDSLPESEAVTRRSKGYMKKDNSWVDNSATLPWRGTSAGGGYSTAGDLLKFATALESGKLLGKDLLAQATRTAQSRIGGGYGFGFGVSTSPAGYGHGGGAPGMNAILRVLPESKVVIVVLANLDPPAAGQLAEFIEQRIPLEH